jgi:hypothetical protein
MPFQLFLQIGLFGALGKFHAIDPEPFLPLGPNLSDLLHSLDRSDHQVPIINQRLIPLLLELEHRVIHQLLAVQPATGLCPFHLAGVVFGLEVTVTFATAEFEDCVVVPYEGHPVAWVHRA